MEGSAGVSPSKKLKNAISIGEITEKNVNQVKMLNSVIFPVPYGAKFYQTVLQNPDLSQIVYYNDVAAGAVCCTLDQTSGNSRLYIMTLGVLAAYRRLRIGQKLLDYVMEIATKNPSVVDVFLHVQINNDDAIAFYKQNGFVVTETIENYYKKIQPAACYLLSKPVTRH